MKQFNKIRNWIKEANDNTDDLAEYGVNGFADWFDEEVEEMFPPIESFAPEDSDGELPDSDSEYGSEESESD